MYSQGLIYFLLCLQFSTFSLLRSILKDTTPICTILLYSEVIKLIICCFFVNDIKSKIFTEKIIIVPTFLFIIMNIISYNVISEISATSYVTLMQLKLPATCILSYFTLQQNFTCQKVFSIFLIFICSVNICKEKQVTNQYIGNKNILFSLLEVILSSICGVYLQKIFRGKDHIWIRNLELCIFSIPVYIILVHNNESTFITTHTGLIFSVIAASGGILVALSLLHCGAVGKTLVSSVSLVLVTIIEHVLYKKIPRFNTITFYTIIISSIFYYNHDLIKFYETNSLHSRRPLLEEESGM